MQIQRLRTNVLCSFGVTRAANMVVQAPGTGISHARCEGETHLQAGADA
jgi:hypothetical protein